MAATTNHQAPTLAVEHEFRRLERVWNADTGYLSSDVEIVAHPAFQQILRLGWDVVPLMLHDLSQAPGLWVWALPEITGENPVPEKERGHIGRMTEAWLRWGKAKGHL